MAHILNEEPVWFTSRRGRYNWDEWLDGRVWHLVKGTDFPGAPEAFRSAASSAAKARQLKVQSKITPEGDVVIKAVPRLLRAESATVQE